jgi:exopolysaccharide production protein ExoQ
MLNLDPPQVQLRQIAADRVPIPPLFQIAEQGFTILSLIFYSSGPLPLILSGGAGQGIEDISPDPTDYSILQALFFCNYLVTVILLILRWKKATYVLTKDWTIGLLMGIALASLMWSSIPKITQVRSIALVGTSLFGLYLASRYTIRQQLKLLGWSFAIIVMMSFLFAFLIPKFGIMSSGVHAGAWRGIYVHKNMLGKMMTIGATVFLLLAMDAKTNHWMPWLGVALSVILLFLSKSSSSIGNSLTIFALIPVYNTLRWSYHLMVPAMIAVISIGSIISLWLSANAKILLESIGKDVTLSGRADMWPFIIEMIQKQPWLGYGYNGFWNDWDSPGAYVWYAAKWTPPNSHNGFLDLWLELGFVGIFIFAIGFGMNLLRGLKLFRIDRSWQSFWTLLYLTFIILANIGESSLLNRNDLCWLLYVTVSFSLAIATTNLHQIAQTMPDADRYLTSR